MTPVKNDLRSLSRLELSNVTDLYRYFHFPSPLHDNFDIRELDHRPSDLFSRRIPNAPPSFYFITITIDDNNVVFAEIKKGGCDMSPLIIIDKITNRYNDVRQGSGKTYLLVISDNTKKVETNNCYPFMSALRGIGEEDFATAEKNTNVEVLCNSFRSIIAELHLAKPNRAELIYGHINLLLLYLQRINATTIQAPMPARSMMVTASRSLALRFRESVQRHISTAEIGDEVKTVDFYARQLLVHPNHLSAVIKKCTGQSPSNFIHQQLLDKAKTLLTQTAYSAKEIAYRLAFKDPAHFNTFFRKHTNQTPINFREHHTSSTQPQNPSRH